MEVPHARLVSLGEHKSGDHHFKEARRDKRSQLRRDSTFSYKKRSLEVADFRHKLQETAKFRRNAHEATGFRRNSFVQSSLSLLNSSLIIAIAGVRTGKAGRGTQVP